MRALVVTLLGLYSALALAQTEIDYRDMSVAALKKETSVHLFFMNGRKFKSVDEIPGIDLQYYLEQGQSYTRQLPNEHGWKGSFTVNVVKHPISESEQEIRDMMKMGYYPDISITDFPRSSEIWQNGTPFVRKLDPTKTFCQVGMISKLGPNGELSPSNHPGDPFPRLTVESVETNHSSKAFGTEIILHNEAKGMYFSASCFTPPSQADFTVGELEDVFNGAILFKGAEFTKNPGQNPIALTGLKVQVRKDISPTHDRLNATLIQDGRILAPNENENQSRPYCVVQGYKDHLGGTIRKGNGPGAVDDAWATGGENYQPLPYVNVRVLRKGGPVARVLSIVDKNYTGFSLWCTMNDGARIPTIDI